ncbi:MAG: hypothetical protein HUU54_15950, partial [Ignavibacteriaceae bacterium]|nr:hypothetical protein [Ignavibacteriaceae bacterium]
MRWNLIFVLLLVFFSWSCNQEETVSPVGPDTGGTSGTLLISFPNGGEVLTAGTTRVIRWTATSTSNVNIEFTANGGQQWLMVAAGVPNVGFYSWTPIPDSVSTTCLIRVTDAANGRITDISDNFFTIIPNLPKSISVTSPAAGDTLYMGKSHTIRWVSANIENVRLQYSINNGASWANIIASVPADSQKYVWSPVPEVVSNQCKIRIADVLEDSIAAETPGNFVIKNSQTINVLAPAGGETITIGTSYEIRWTSTDLANVKLEYSTNNGSAWVTITSSTPSDGSFIWAVPNLPTVFGLIRISDAADNTPAAISSGNFTLAVLPSLTVTSPNGSEVLRAGESSLITWSSSGSIARSHKGSEEVAMSGGNKTPQSIPNVKIEYSTNGGVTWIVIAASTANDGTYSWASVPSTATNQGRVKISDAIDGDPFDISDNDFTIQVPEPKIIAVTSPNGGENWEAGSTKNITWTASGVSNIKIEYSTNNGATYTNIVSSYSAQAGIYSWAGIPNTPSSLCLVKISDVSDNQAFDVSNSQFTISPPQDIRVISPNGGEKLSSGGTFNIQWTSQNVQTVKIDYTTNNGFEWNPVVASTESDGFYTWNPVPNVLSTNCKIRVSDAGDSYPSDASDSVFSILIEPTLTVTYPNGGERIIAGSSVNITWTTATLAKAGRGRQSRSGLTEDIQFTNVKIEYTTDGGSVWTTIIASTSNNGLYTWSPVPTVNASNCKVRISDSEDGIPVDLSDSTFAIVSETSQSIQLTAPNGGESFSVGGSTGISWSSSGILNVNLEFTTNNGVSWSTIVNGTESDGYYLWSPIPNVSSTNCKVRVSDATDSLPFDISDATFSIFPTPSLSVVAPNGGESFTTGTQQNIQWSSQNIEAVKIEVTTNNGASWSVIIDSTESDGIYLWTVPNVNSTLCRVRLSSLPGNLVNDISDNNFTISNIQPQSLSVTQPNGGESWVAGTMQPVKWVSSGVDSVKIEYTTNNGVNWNMIVSGTESDGFYNWTVPNANTANARIRISDYTDGFPSDQSDNVFSINTEDRLTVLSPNGGERILAGTSQTITWSTTNLTESGKEGINSVKIELSTDGGLTFTSITTNATNTGSYVWNPVPNFNSSLCRIRVSDTEDGIPSDISDSNFVIYNQVAQEINVTAPNGGEQLSAGGNANITWTSLGVSSVNIEYTTNNGVSWTTIVTGTESDGYYLWSPIPNLSSTNCRIKISDAVDSIPFDQSNNTFTILPLPTISVLSPNGGESYTTGTQQNITWTSQSVASVKLEFTINNGASWTTIADSTESDGIYLWTIPNVNSNLCRIRVSNYPGNTVSDISDNNFAISNAQPQSVTLLTPNGGEEWYSGTIQSIRWISSGIDSVKLEYSTNNGLNWTTIINGTESDGFYNWTVPNANTSNAIVRVSDYADGTPSDISNAVFSILTETTLRLTSPNGGERILSGTAQTITWSTNSLKVSGKESIPSVKLELSTDGGLTFSTIISSTLNLGSYNWSPVPNVNSALCRIRVSDAEDGAPSDISDSNFVIFNQPVQEVTVTFPDGGEQFTAGTSMGITWTSTGISTVTILFTTNNGVNWSNVVTGTESDGYYLWSPVPNVSSTNCRIKIVDAVDSLPFDESNSTFTIQPQPSVRVINPNGGESLTAGNSYNITWQSANVSNVKIEFTSNNGAAWSTVIATTPSTGVYSWTVPNVVTTLCKLRVSDADAANGIPSDESDNTFEITSAVSSSIVVTAPAGGEIWASGSSQNIEWTSSGVNDVKIEFTTDNGQSWTQIVQST